MSSAVTSIGKTSFAPRGGQKLPSIQVLRGLAASLVVFHHYATAVRDFSARPSWIVNSGLGILGASGVDLFFVISGFIMVYTTTRKAGPSDAISFLKKRAVRIYPLYWVWTTVLLLVSLLWHSSGAQSAHHYSLAFKIKSYLLIPAFDGKNFHPLLSQGWTLSFEMLFYIVFACGILINFKRWKLPFLIVSFAALMLLGLVLPEGSGIRYLLSEPMILEFLFGVLAAELLFRLPAIQETGWLLKLPVALIALGAAALLSSVVYTYPSYLRFLVWGAPALLIVFGAAMLGPKPGNRFLVYLGDASYSIYLTHGFFSLGFSTAMKRFPALGRVSPDATIVVMGIATILFSSLFYPLVERRLMAALSSRSKTLKKPSAVEMGTVVVRERTIDPAKLTSVS